MYNRDFITLARAAQDDIYTDDPELAQLLLRLQDIPLPALQDVQASCSICLGQATEPVSLQCGHVFCESCLTSMAKTNPGSPLKCPLCRRESVRQQHILSLEGTREEYVSQQKRRLDLIRDGIARAEALVSSFKQVQDQYRAARGKLEAEILREQLGLDLLEIEAPNHDSTIATLEEKTQLLREALSGLGPDAQ